jgi:hypothetical protein
MYRPPASLFALRDFTAGGTAFAKGHRLTLAEITPIRRSLRYLIGRGVVGSAPELYGRKGRQHKLFRPSYIAPGALAHYQAAATVTLTAVKGTAPNDSVFTCDVAGTGFTPTTCFFEWGDGLSETVAGTHVVHGYHAPGSYTINVTAWDSAKAGQDSKPAVATGAVTIPQMMRLSAEPAAADQSEPDPEPKAKAAPAPAQRKVASRGRGAAKD